jgi:Tfp pilus assembly protein PilE
MLNLKNEKGVTLIALILTIIILLILAGVSISAVFDDNGLLKSMEKEKESSENKKAYSQEKINGLYNELVK